MSTFYYFLLENLWEIIQALLKDNVNNYESPAIVYTRMEIIGKEQLQQKTLKDIGLVSGKALLRFVNYLGDIFIDLMIYLLLIN